MKFALIELKFNVKTFFNADLHLDRSIRIWLFARISDNKFLLLRYPVIIPIYHYINVIAQSNDDSVVAFELLFYPIELEVVRDIIAQGAGWLQISDYLQEC